ncbi:MAG: hypothetical protein IKS52_04615 [Clostridia bacterium]|nr:hypothetical protein [Clostridia bacterium]
MDEMLRQYDLLCERVPGADELAAMDQMRGVWYKTQTIRSGALLEVEAFPMLPAHQARAVRRLKPTSQAQARVNQRNAEKRMLRLAEANFTEADYYFTGTIEGPDLPDWKSMQKLVRKFIRKMNDLRRAKGMKNAKYIYVLEGHEDGDRRKRLHWHALLEGGLTREELKTLWEHGCARVDELDMSRPGGLRPLMSYLSKGPQGNHRWACSKGLKQPRVTATTRKINARKAWRIAESGQAAQAALEKLYPGYEYVDSEVRTNPFVPGCYIYAMMRKKEGEPCAKPRKS